MQGPGSPAPYWSCPKKEKEINMLGFIKIGNFSAGCGVHACNSSTWEVKAGVSQVQGQPGYIARHNLKTIKLKTSL
jgi:hypothetical protein